MTQGEITGGWSKTISHVLTDAYRFSSEHPDQTLYLGWTWIIIKVLSVNVVAGDLLVSLHRRISLFFPLFSFEVLQRAAWTLESWTSLDLKTLSGTLSSNCASTSQMSRSSFTSTSTYLLWNRWDLSRFLLYLTRLTPTHLQQTILYRIDSWLWKSVIVIIFVYMQIHLSRDVLFARGKAVMCKGLFILWCTTKLLS